MRYLLKNELFRDLSESDMQELDRITAMTTCEPGRIFYAPGETGEVFFLLKKGRVQIYRLSPEGKKLVIATLEAGTLFGEMALVGQGMYNTFAEAVEPCILCAMSRRDVEMLIARFPKVGLRFLEVMGQRLTEAERRLEGLAFKSIPAQLAALLLQLARDNCVEGYTHQQLAEMIGTYRETVTQILDDFKAQGLIEIGRKQIEIRDARRLRELAEE
ncbi:MAG: Crp/Fnr family transcriptional regulator [Chloroflexi bacterium]|nr:Crp/Fnr family transcriptional regulator [Chloroflexota bacterium]